jgi:NAD(P)H dehydrogenase (quinone)
MFSCGGPSASRILRRHERQLPATVTIPLGANVLVVFYSRTGVTETLALAASIGAVQARASIRLRRLRDSADEKTMAAHQSWIEHRQRMSKEYVEPTPADVAWADAIILAVPHGFDTSSPEVSGFLAVLKSSAIAGSLEKKVAGAFVSTSIPERDDPSVSSILSALTAAGLVVVSPAESDVDLAKPQVADKSMTPHTVDVGLAQSYGRTLARKAHALRTS